MAPQQGDPGWINRLSHMRLSKSEISTLSIGYMSPGWPLDANPNGVVSYIADMVEHLPRMGHQATVVANNVAGEQHDPSIYDMQRVRSARNLAQRLVDGLGYRIAPRWASTRINRRTLLTTVRRAIAARGIQLFEMEEAFGWSSWVRQVSSIPVCVRLHGPWFLNGVALGAPQDHAFRRRVDEEGCAIAEADAITAPSHDVLERTRAFYGLALPRAEVIPPTTPSVLPSARWRLNDCDPDLVLFVGRFDRHKGGDLIIEAFGRVLRNVSRARLYFVGPDRGYVDPNGRRWSLDEFVRDRLPGALESGQLSILGQQPYSALAALRRKASVTVICSRYENCPRALLETMSIGCPLVAARVGGMPEIVQDQIDGLLHATEDADDLAAKITCLLNDPRRAAQLGHQAALTCEHCFYPEIIVARMIDFYRRAIARVESPQRPSDEISKTPYTKTASTTPIPETPPEPIPPDHASSGAA
jgi:glycosyltransferase involved in cell wall biosynthesis